MRLAKSRDIILNIALKCFLQHGYNATSIAMVSRYANISRVTIHKQFSSKEDLFRNIMFNDFLEKDEQIKKYTNHVGDFWAVTYEFLLQRRKNAFEEIPNSLIKADLVHAIQRFCSDILKGNQIKTRSAIEIKLQSAINNRTLTLKNLNLTIAEFAKNIEIVADGITLSNTDEEPEKIIKQTLHIYKIATLYVVN
jgi:AcrR family transcriptional regulator